MQFEKVFEFLLIHIHMKHFFNMIHNSTGVLSSFNAGENVHLKELEKTWTKFSGKYRILIINTIYFSKDFITLREGKEIKKESI